MMTRDRIASGDLKTDDAFDRGLLIPEDEAALKNDDVYTERNRLVAALAKVFPSGIARPPIEGWDPEWLNVCYIDLPTGQASWHYHDRDAFLFEGLPAYEGSYDGHTTPEKYNRLFDLPPDAGRGFTPHLVILDEAAFAPEENRKSEIDRPGRLSLSTSLTTVKCGGQVWSCHVCIEGDVICFREARSGMDIVTASWSEFPCHDGELQIPRPLILAFSAT